MKAEDGIVNFVAFIRFSRLSRLGIYSTLFQKKRILLEMIISYLIFGSKTIISKMVSSTVLEWNKLDLNICNSESLTSFKGNILKIIRPSENSVFLYNNLKRIQLLTRLRPGLSHLREHKFKHNFQDTFQDTTSSNL